METRWLESGESVDAGRGEVVACIPVYGGHELFVECLNSVLVHTPPSVRIMILDDASPDDRTRQHVLGLAGVDGEHRLLYLRRENNVGFPANVNGAFAATAPADVVVLNSDCLVAEGWIERLHEAAYETSRVATATPLTNHGSIVSTPNPRDPGSVAFGPEDLDTAAAAVRRHSRRLRPRLPTAIGHCMYVRRTALELVGDFDLAFTPGYGEEVDFSQRCLLSGLHHVLADDVLVLHHGGGSFSPNGDRHFYQEAHEREIGERYPYYHDGLRALERTGGRLSLALRVAGRALDGLAVTLDLRGSDDPEGIFPLVRALVATEEIRLTLIAGDAARAAADGAAAGLEGVMWCAETELHRAGHADVVHRLNEVARGTELEDLRRLGDRTVLTQRDLARFHNPGHFEDFASWEAHRATVRRALSGADAIICPSDCARAEAIAEGLIGRERAHTVRPGISDRSTGTRRRPHLLRDMSDGQEVIVCFASSGRESNRVFALRLVEELQERHQWDGELVIVGPEVQHGSSFADEQRQLARSPRLAEVTSILPAVDAAEREWLLDRSSLVLSLALGTDLDLTPLQAALHETPSLWAPASPLSELMTQRDVMLVPWDARLSCDAAFALLRDDRCRRVAVAAAREAANARTWSRTASELLAAYDGVFGSEPQAAPPGPPTHVSQAPDPIRVRGQAIMLGSRALRRLSSRSARGGRTKG